MSYAYLVDENRDSRKEIKNIKRCIKDNPQFSEFTINNMNDRIKQLEVDIKRNEKLMEQYWFKITIL